MDRKSGDHYDLIEESLNLVAEKDIDLTPGVYAHLFNMWRDAEEVFEGIPNSQRGIMLNKVVELVIACSQGEEKIRELRQFDIPLHDDIGVTQRMYHDYFDALICALKDVLGWEWLDRHEVAWTRQFHKLISEVMLHSEGSGWICAIDTWEKCRCSSADLILHVVIQTWSDSYRFFWRCLSGLDYYRYTLPISTFLKP